MTFAGEVKGAMTELRLTGRELRYLLFTDRTEIEMEFSKVYSTMAPYSNAKLIVTDHPEAGRYYSYVTYDGDSNAFIGGVAKVEGDFDAIVISDVDSSGGEAIFIREK